MRQVHWILCVAALTAGCGGAEPTPKEPVEPAASSTLAELRRVAAELDRLAGKAEGSADLAEVPTWARLGPYKVSHGEPEVPQPQELRDVVGGDHPPQVRALACMWLSAAKQVSDLELFDELLDSREPAGSFPSVRVTQQVQPSYPVTWSELTLGQAALDAAGTVLGKYFEDTAEYRRWRAEQGDLERSVVYWEGVLEAEASAEARAERVNAIRERDPELLVRLVLTADESHRYLYDVSDEQVEALVAERFDVERLERLLRRQERWPEFGQPSRFGRFAAWVFDHFEAISSAADRDVLLELWESWPCPDENWVRRNLALAVARAHPEKRTEILLAVLEERPTPWMADVLKELLDDGLGDQREAVEPWFFTSDSPSADENRAAIISALSQGQNGKADIGRLVRDERFSTDSPQVIQALIEAARELGKEIECGESLKAVGTGEIVEHAKHRPREITPADEQRAQQARAACLKRIERWLRGK